MMKTMFSKGDKVSVLDDAINGVVKIVNGDDITVETSDGFLMTYNVKELIKENNSSDLYRNIESINLSRSQVEKQQPAPRSFTKEKKSKKEIPAPEFDLHIEKLVKNSRSMSNYDILTLQTETAKRHVDFAIRNRIPKIILIHGVGEGILKAELDFMLGRFDNIIFHDANYQKYGVGATEITIKQNSK